MRIQNYDSFVVFVADDALVLDHHPYRDRHLILAVLTRGSGVQRGVLRRARGGKTPPAAAATSSTSPFSSFWSWIFPVMR